MAIRLGPQLSFVTEPDVVPPIPPVEPPGKLLVEVQARIKGAIRQDNGLYTLGVEIDTPPYSAETHKQLLRAWAVTVPDGSPLPEGGQAFLDSTFPKYTVETQGFDGATHFLPVADVPAGQSVTQILLQDED